jgi:hypothetical protein
MHAGSFDHMTRDLPFLGFLSADANGLLAMQSWKLIISYLGHRLVPVNSLG